MAKKTCPECNKTHGTRKKVCECGHEFGRHPAYPEPGAWVGDEMRNMPKLSAPSPLPQGKIDPADLRDQYIAYEGLGFCIYTYIPAAKIEDAKLRGLWAKARRAMQNIVDYLESV